MTSKRVPNLPSKQDPEWNVVVNRKRCVTVKDTDDDTAINDDSKIYQKRAEKRKIKQLLAETNATALFDEVSAELAAPGNVVDVILPNDMEESELFKARLKPEWVVCSHEIICPDRRNNERIPEEYRNQPNICMCKWTGKKCEKGLWMLIRNPKTSSTLKTVQELVPITMQAS